MNLASKSGQPPWAKRRPKDLSIHSRRRVDPYYWLRDDARDNGEVIAYLEQENAYLRRCLENSDLTRKAIHEEIIARLPPEDRSVPFTLGPYEYFDRYRQGDEYEVFCRHPKGRSEQSTILLDLNERAKSHPSYELGGLEISDNHNLLAFTEDVSGDGQYELRIKDIATGALLPDHLVGLSGELAWASDGETLFYVSLNAETQRADRVFRHQLGDDQARDAVVFEEADTSFEVSVSRTRSLRFVEIASASTLSTEVSLIDAAKPHSAPWVFLPRADGHEYFVLDHEEYFYILTNWNAPNFKVARTSLRERLDVESWQTVVPHRANALLAEAEIFERHLVYAERVDGLQQLQCLDLHTHTTREMPIPLAAGIATLDDNPVSSAPFVRYAHSNLVQPWTVHDYSFANAKSQRRKQDAVGGGYQPEVYATKQIWANARDGSQIPICLAYRHDTQLREAPALLEVYGAYGACLDPTFCYATPSLLDRGFVYAVVQVRGGMEKGRHWYEGGRKGHKGNSVTDFLDAAEYLGAHAWANPAHLCGTGASAGGLVIGAAANQRPDLFHALIASVPFVDLVTTMLDPSVPLTSLEYDEWGNPEIREEFEAMMALSPYDNVVRQRYPHMLITAGLHDSRVGYWEPAKWAARLRASRSDSGLTLLHTDLDAGHFGRSGRFQSYDETALQFAFLLHTLRN